MSDILGTLFYRITGDTADLDRNVDRSRRKVGELGDEIETTGKKISAFVKGAITTQLIAAFAETASRMDELQNKFDTVFGEVAASTEAWAEEYAAATSRGQLETMEFLASQQDVRTGFGDTVEKAAEFSKAVVGIANDLSSFSNIPIDEAIAAVNSGLNGEFEALRRLGVGLNVAIINQMDYAESIGKTWDEMGNLERQEAVLSGIVSQSANALHQSISVWQDYDYTLGDAALTAESFANQMQGFKGTLADFMAEIGDELIPVISTGVRGLSSLMRGFNDLSGSMQTAVISATAFASSLLLIGGPIGAAVGFLAAASIGLGSLRTSSDRLESSMEDLSEATDAYREASDLLADSSENMTSKQRALLETERELAAARAQNALSDVTKNYVDNLEAIELAYGIYLDKKGAYDAMLLARTGGIEEVEKTLAGLVRRGRENLTRYEKALADVLATIRNEDPGSAGFGANLLSSYEAMKDAQEEWLTSQKLSEEALSQLGIWLNQGLLDISAYEEAFPDLCREIRAAAQEISDLEEAADDSSKSMEKAASASSEWRDELRKQRAEMLEDEGDFSSALSIRQEMLRDEHDAAIRELALDSGLIESGENATEASIEDLRRRLRAHDETNAELLALDEYYANEEIILQQDVQKEIDKAAEKRKETAEDISRMLREQKAEMDETAAAALEEAGGFEEALELRKATIAAERDAEIAALEEKVEAEEATEEDILALREYYDGEMLRAERESVEKQKEYEKEKAEEIKEINRQLGSELVSTISSVTSSIGDIYSSLTERRLEEIDREKEAALEALGLQEDTEIEKLQKEYSEAVKNGDMELAAEKEREIQRQRIEEESEERKRKAQKEEAERSKALAIFQATIDTLAAVIGFMSDPGGLPGAAMSAMAAATGAAQIAAIAAEPLPSYAVGAVDIDRDQIAQLHQGELVIPKTFAEGIRDGDISIGGAESKVEVTIINNTGSRASVDRMDDGTLTRLRITIGNTVSSEISKGRFDTALTERYQISRRNPRG